MYSFFQKLLFALDAERAHHLSVQAARAARATTPKLLTSWYAYEHPMLRQTIWGLDFANPLGLAAGFDKNGVLVRFWETVGFGFVEVGSVSAQPAKGNPRPRAFRLKEDRALINRMGLNNHGAKRIAERLKGTLPQVQYPVGINLAKTHSPAIMGDAALEDFRMSFREVAPLASYIVLNISCPNTTEGKTFEDAEALNALLQTIFEERKALQLSVPVLVKVSPPASERVVFDSTVDVIISLCRTYGISGFIATNTASDRRNLKTSTETLNRIGRGGLSGAPLENRSTHLVRYIYQKTEGAIPIIGVGGVSSAEGAYAKIRAGASLVQLYTGLIYEGPLVIKQIKEGLVERLQKDGFTRISDAVGVDALG